jgi:hypothetical protein
LDARIARLQDQALGAFINHAEGTLDDLAAFQLTLFSSSGVGALANAIAAGIAPLPPDPPLTALEQQGKAVFIRACAQCHGGPIVARFHDIATTCPRPLDTVFYIQLFAEIQAVQPPGVFPPVASTDGAHFDRAPKPEE